MSRKIYGVLLILLAGILVFPSCQFSALQSVDEENLQIPGSEPTLSMFEQAKIKASIEASVESTRMAMGYRPVPDMVDEAGWQLRQYPMKELIKREIYDALDSASKVSNLTVTSSYDKQISQDEIIAIGVDIEEAKKEIGNNIYRLGIYYDAYSAFADEGITYLNDVEVELRNVYDSLEDFKGLLYQGEGLLNNDPESLESAAIELNVRIDIAKENCENDFEQYDALLEEWEAEWLAIPPDVEISEPMQVFDLLEDYVDIVFAVTEDDNVDHEEIEQLIQAAVNARYAVEIYDQDDLQSAGESLTKMIGWIVDGDGNQIKYGIKNFMIYYFQRENEQ